MPFPFFSPFLFHVSSWALQRVRACVCFVRAKSQKMVSVFLSFLSSPTTTNYQLHFRVSVFFFSCVRKTFFPFVSYRTVLEGSSGSNSSGDALETQRSRRARLVVNTARVKQEKKGRKNIIFIFIFIFFSALHLSSSSSSSSSSFFSLSQRRRPPPSGGGGGRKRASQEEKRTRRLAAAAPPSRGAPSRFENQEKKKKKTHNFVKAKRTPTNDKLHRRLSLKNSSPTPTRAPIRRRFSLYQAAAWASPPTPTRAPARVPRMTR